MKKQPLTHSSKNTKFVVSAILILFIILTAAFVLLPKTPKQMQADLERLTTESYDSVFLSMYPVTNYQEETYAYWRGMDTVVTSYSIPDTTTLQKYLKEIQASGNILTTMYLGISPDQISVDKLAPMLAAFPDANIEIILPYPSMDYWLALSAEECSQTLQAFSDFAQAMLPYRNVAVYFFGGSEWLITNPANYEDIFLTTADISETLMLHSDREHAYCLSAEDGTAPFNNLARLIESYRNSPVTYPNLSDWNIIFFGDSVIGNYTDSTSIPGVVAGLTDAKVYNLGYGGSHMTQTDEDMTCFPTLMNAFMTQNISALPPEASEKPFPSGLALFYEAAPADKLCFVINYGLNDYFSGRPLTSADTYDIYSFTGALRTTISELQSAYPDAYILINTPNFSSYFNNGTDYMGEYSGTLADYADAIKEIAAELNIELLDNFYEMDINADNYSIYLSDGCHPNETGRLLMGQRIALKLEKILCN